HRQRLDVLRIEVRRAVREVEAAILEQRWEQLVAVLYLVVDRQTIDHDERLVVAADRTHTAQNDLGRSTRNTRVAHYLETRDTTLKRVRPVLLLRLRDQVTAHSLLRSAQRLARR